MFISLQNGTHFPSATTYTYKWKQEGEGLHHAHKDDLLH